VEDEETLKTSALISELSNSIEAKIDDFLSDGVMSTSVVVSGIFLSGDELFRVEELSVCSSSNFVNYGGFEIKENASRNVLSSSSLGEESVEGIVSISNSLVRGHLSVRLDSMFKAVKLPASVTGLNSGLSNVDRNNFSHDCLKMIKYRGGAKVLVLFL